MTTLAQMWVENRRASEVDLWPSSRLRQTSFVGDRLAQRYVFEEDLGELREAWVKAGQLSHDTILETVRLPTPCTWIEWKNEYVQAGVLIETVEGSTDFHMAKNAEGNKIACLAIGSTARGMPECLFAGGMKNLPFSSEEDLKYLAMGWCNKADYKAKPLDRSAFCFFVIDALFGLFLLQQPKVVKLQKHEFKPSLQEARRKKGKMPVLDFSKVYITIGKAAVRNHSADPVKGEPGTGTKRKYHYVTFHWKKVTLKGGKKEARFIDGHWRGDPKLGMAVREVHAKIAK